MIPTKKRIPREKRIENAMLNCYRELFANSTPKGDFDKLMEEAELNEFGQKVIPFINQRITPLKFMPTLSQDVLMDY